MNITTTGSSFLIVAFILWLPFYTIYGQEKEKTKPELTDSSSVKKDSIVLSDFKISNGYSEQWKNKTTGSVSVADPSDLNKIPSGNLTNQLQGRLPGVNVIGNGQPGSIARVRIRGFSSFENNDPLYIIDGVPTQDVSALNPGDIASLQVLKDAGSAAIYGSRAANGVIVITTKPGSKGLKINYNGFTGIQSPGSGPKNLLNADEYSKLQWLVYKNDGTVETHPFYGLSTNPEPTMPAWAANTDWYDIITRKAGIQNHDLSLSGGSDNSKFYVSMGYFRQDGIILNTHAERYSARFNSEFTFLKNRLKLGENVTAIFRSNLSVPNLSADSPIMTGPYRSQSIIPYIIIKPVAGFNHNFVPGEFGGTGIAWRLGNAPNAYADLVRAKDNKYHNIYLSGSAYLDLKIFEGLAFRSTFGGNWNNGYGITYISSTYERSENVSASSLTENAWYGNDWVWTNNLTFNKSFGDHNLLSVAGYEALKYGIGRNMNVTKSGYFSDSPDYRTITNGATMVSMNSDMYTPVKVASAFASVNYDFRNTYLLSASIRRDRSSLFNAGSSTGVFPSVSAGWRISNEKFFSNIKWINDLKIRGSYGKLGNQFALSPQNLYLEFGAGIGDSYYDINGTGNSAVPGFYPVRIANPDARWEETVMTNIGIDGRLFKGKFGFYFDWFSRRGSDLLFNPQLPGTSGAGAAPYVNTGSIKNSGMEIGIGYDNKWGNFGISLNTYISTYRNKISKVGGEYNFFDSGVNLINNYYGGGASRNMPEHPLSSFYGFRVEGLFKNESEVAAAPSQDGAAPGLFRFANITRATDPVNNWEYINYEDRTFIGDPNPKFTYGLNIGLTYKSLDLGAFLYGSRGNDIFNFTKWWTDFWPSYQGQKSKDLLYRSWRDGNSDTSVPRASNISNFSTNTQVCSYYIENGSYLRLKSLEVGYTLPKKLTNKLWNGSLRAYFQVVNLFTITKYSGLDPEIGGSDTSFGVDAGNYPNVRQFILGINLSI